MQGDEVGSPTEEVGNLINQEEVEAEVEEVEVEIGKEEQVAGMTMMISASILDLLIPAGINTY